MDENKKDHFRGEFELPFRLSWVRGGIGWWNFQIEKVADRIARPKKNWRGSLVGCHQQTGGSRKINSARRQKVFQVQKGPEFETRRSPHAFKEIKCPKHQWVCQTLPADHRMLSEERLGHLFQSNQKSYQMEQTVANCFWIFSHRNQSCSEKFWRLCSNSLRW